MALIVNGITVEKVICNGTELDKVIANGVEVFTKAAQYQVSISAFYLTLTNFGPAVEGQDFTTVLAPREGYSAPAKSMVNVKIGGTVYTGFTYSQATDGTGAATLTIPGSAVLGNILITANGVSRSQYALSIGYSHCKSSYAKTNRYVNGTLEAVNLTNNSAIYKDEIIQYHAEAEDGWVTTWDRQPIIDGAITVTSDISLNFKFDKQV